MSIRILRRHIRYYSSIYPMTPPYIPYVYTHTAYIHHIHTLICYWHAAHYALLVRPDGYAIFWADLGELD